MNSQLKYKKFVLSLFFALIIILVAIFAPLIATHDPYEINISMVQKPPSSENLFGTDKLGRDVFSRVIFGGRTSISSALILVFFAFAIGSALGITAGYFGGKIETVIMRISDIFISFPEFVLAIAIAGILGPNLLNAILAILTVSWAKYARLSRSLVIKIKNKDYVSSAILNGSKPIHILKEYMLKISMPVLITTATADIGTMILELSSLSFLGFGVQPPTPEWGLMLNEGRSYIITAPWLIIFPGLAIFIVVAIFNLLGDNIRDMLDPKQQ